MLSVTSPQALCQLCGGNLDTSLLEGSCPACLWGGLIAGGFADEVAEDLPEIEGYKIRHQIGRGGMGVVYLATQESPARDVALKIVAPYTFRGASQRLRFLVEIEAMAAVAHPALLPLYESGEDDEGRPWFSMRLASGGNLAEKLLQYQGQWQLAATLMVRLAEAVQYSHERGILHRDLKPANVLFDEEGNAYVADFGLAKWAENDVGLTQSTEMLGSPVYLAPEAVLGGTKATTTASDIYGLGTIFYELLTGHKLYDGASAAGVMTQILQNAPVPPRQKVATIPRDLEIITLKAISRDPGKRYVSAAALAEDLQLWLAGKAIKARPVGPFEQLWNWTRRNPAMAALACLLLVSIVTGGVLLWRSNQRLTISLADAEDRVEFMTRELPVSLAPLGRLDLLDDIFKNLDQHYQGNNRTDADSLARQADFLTQWAQIYALVVIMSLPSNGCTWPWIRRRLPYLDIIRLLLPSCPGSLLDGAWAKPLLRERVMMKPRLCSLKRWRMQTSIRAWTFPGKSSTPSLPWNLPTWNSAGGIIERFRFMLRKPFRNGTPCFQRSSIPLSPHATKSPSQKLLRITCC